LTELFKITYDQLFLAFGGKMYKGLLLKVEKEQNIGRWYDFTTFFFAALLVSLIFVNRNLTWHFPLTFGLSGFLAWLQTRDLFIRKILTCF